MEIILANPQGFCRGVIQAIAIAKKTLADKSLPQPIYMLGSIVHNKYITQGLKDLGLITISEKDIPLLTKGTIIFSAHGVSPKVYNLVQEKGLNIVDATCPKVMEVHNLVNTKINEGYDVLFLGKENHEETIGVLGINDKIKLVPNNLKLNGISDKTILVSQTTLSHIETEAIYDLLKKSYPHLQISNQICNATYNRQKAAIKASVNVDLAIVVGDKSSNNCQTLAKTINDTCHVKTILIESIADLKDFDFTNISKIALTSGASTPRALINEVYDNLMDLKNCDFTSCISYSDCLNIKK